MRKYYLAIISCFLIIILAACSDDKESTSEKPVESSKSEVDQDEKSLEVNEGKYDKVIPVEDLEDRDYGGLEFTLVGPNLPALEMDAESSEVKEKWLERIEQLEEKWNFTFTQKLISYNSFLGDYIRTTLAGDPIGDIGYVHSFNFYPSLAVNGIAHPISDFNIIDFDDPKWVTAATRASQYKGKTYSATPAAIESVIVRDGVWFNKTQFENLGIPSLYDLYENGEWTWDKMFEIAELATRDLDNDGKIDVYGFASAHQLAYDLIYNNGAEAVVQTKNGIEVNFNDPKIVEALEYYQKVRKDHARVFLQPKEEGGGTDVRGDFRDGRLLMVVNDWWISTSDLNGGRMKDDYGFVPFPAGPSYENPEQPVSVGHDSSMQIMFGTVKDKKGKLEIWDEITNFGTAEDWARWTRADYEIGASDAESVKYALLMHENVKTNLINGFGELNGIANQLFTDIGSGAVSVQTGLESITPQIAAALEVFEKDGVDLGISEEEIEKTKKELEDGTYGEEKGENE